MLINAILLVLRESLEAALLISVLYSMVCQLRMGRRGFLGALLLGVALATLYSRGLDRVSEWFDYRGQELVNAALHLVIAGLVIAFCHRLGRDGVVQPAAGHAVRRAPARRDGVLSLLASSALMFVVIREGSEVITYLWGNWSYTANHKALLSGALIGLGIGLSLGVLLYLWLINLRAGWDRRVALILLALFTGNMLAQAVLQLHQGDLLSHGAPLWDSGDWLSEGSLLGRLLYALVGYEATPSPYQILGYLLGVAAVLGVSRRAFRRRTGSIATTALTSRRDG